MVGCGENRVVYTCEMEDWYRIVRAVPSGGEGRSARLQGGGNVGKEFKIFMYNVLVFTNN